MTIDEMVSAVANAPKGATFVRVDLHIHSFGDGGSFDVADAKMTPETIVAEAVRLGLGVIAITDHNSIANVERAVLASRGRPVLVVPGVEITTPGGHLLVYAETYDALQRIYGSLNWSKDRRDCRTSILDLLAATENFGGIAIAAHVDRESGMEASINGYGDAKAGVFASPTLVAIEVALRDNLDWFSATDANDARRSLFENRIAVINDPFTRVLPRIQSSDAHSLGALGRNWSKEQKLTRLKLSRLDWTSFRAAFADPEARVRVENSVPETVPRFVGLRIEGGFLDGQTFAFGDNLTCIIGGRGSGKSTAYHVVQALCGHAVDSALVDSDVWPTRACLVYRDEAGQMLEYVLDESGVRCRASGADVEPPAVDFSSLAQGQMAGTIRDCRSDPSVLLAFLDDLLDLKVQNEQLEACGEELRRNGDSLVKVGNDLSEYEDLKKRLETKKQQSDAFKAANGDDLVRKQTTLTTAIRVRRDLVGKFDLAIATLATAVSDLPLESLTTIADGAENLVECPEDSPFPKIAKRFDEAKSQFVAALDAARQSSRTEIEFFAASTQKQQEAAQQQISEELAKLKERGITPDMKFLQRITTEIDQLEGQLKKLDRKVVTRKTLVDDRNKLVARFRDLHNRRFLERQNLATRLTGELRNFLVDWEITVKFREGRLASDFETHLKEAMDWRTAAVPKAAALVDALGVAGVQDAVKALIGPRKDRKPLQDAKCDGQAILATWDIDSMAEKLGSFQTRRRLQEIGFDDLPRIIVSRPILDANGKASGRVLHREFAELSLGQQQAIALAILLSVRSTKPLIIDQPEDNLDGEFIFQILVRALRQIKEHRQVILITHNANIAVLGDSDQVIPLKPQADKSVILQTGTVENPPTRELVCGILEGGRAAYRKRGQLYGM